jgi:hypothetical protein
MKYINNHEYILFFYVNFVIDPTANVYGVVTPNHCEICYFYIYIVVLSILSAMVNSLISNLLVMAANNYASSSPNIYEGV